MERSPAKRKNWILVLILLLAGIVLVAAVLTLAGGAGLSARYDVAEEVITGYDPSAGAALTMECDGTLTLRLNRADIYWYAGRYGVLEEVRSRLAAAGTPDVGFRLSDGQLTVYARCRTLGLLRLSYRAQCDVSWQDGALVISPRKVWLGRSFSLPRSRWPSIFSGDLHISLEKVTSSVLDAGTEGDALVLRLEGLRAGLTGQLTADRGLLEERRIFGFSDRDSEAISFMSSLRGEDVPMGEACLLCLDSPDAPAVLTEILACSSPESVPSVWESRDDFVRRIWGKPLSQRAGVLRETMDGELAAEQAKYEKLLFAVREMYKSGALALSENGFVSASSGQSLDPAAITSLSATATDCRVVFLTDLPYSTEITLSDMPCLDDVPRVGKHVMEELLRPGATYDLGVVLSSEGDVPLLLYRRADGSFVLRELEDRVYVNLLMTPAIPIVSMDELPAPAAELARPAGEGWAGAVILTR